MMASWSSRHRNSGGCHESDLYSIQCRVFVKDVFCRSQGRNKAECFEKLKEAIREAYVEPKERKIWEGLSEQGVSSQLTLCVCSWLIILLTELQAKREDETIRGTDLS